MRVNLPGITRALLRACALFTCLALSGVAAPAPAYSGMIPPVLRASSVPLLPDLQYFIDTTGTMDVEEVAAPANNQTFRPLVVKDLPRTTGVMWLRFTMAPLPAGGKSQAMLLDMGPDVPSAPVLFEPYTNPATEGVEWREISPTHRNVMLLPESGADPVTCYIRLDGLPGIWFSPMLRTPQDAAGNWGGLSGTAALLALSVVMLLCLLRGLSEKGQWRVWTALYVAVALAQGVLGMPAYGSGNVTLNQALAVLAPGLALMLLPHVGRHLMRTRGRARLLDAQLVLLSLPGAALALLPLFPGFGWLIRYLSLWPACTLIFTLSALGGAIVGLGGARRFLLGCLVPPLFVVAGVMGLDYGIAANLLASAPLWGTALSALLIAGTGLPRDAAQTEDAPAASASASARAGASPLGTSLASANLEDEAITLDQPLDDPNLRLLPPLAAGNSLEADLVGLPADISTGAEKPAAASRRSPNATETATTTDPGLWENLLRPPLDRLMREGAALGHCALPPAVRQYAENMLNAAGEMARLIDNPGKAPGQSTVGEPRTSFNLQHLVREAHDAVTTAAENAGIGLAWYMPPLLGHMYEGQAQALRETLSMLLESAVRATSRGAVHISVRRVPESADPGHLLFTVSDTGAGIPPRDRSSLALTRAWELSGSNNGYLNVECSPQGTSIAFTLRLKPLEQEEKAEETAPQTLVPTIAVVAESAVTRQALAHMITSFGCNSTEARSLHESLQCNREAPALMLVMHSPHGGASEADALGRFEAEALQAGLPLFKALAITSDDSKWDALAESGYTHALLDPVDTEAFTATLREVLQEAQLAPGADAPPEAQQQATADIVDQPEHSPAADATAELAGAAAALEVLEKAEQEQPTQPPLPDLFGETPIAVEQTTAPASTQTDAPLSLHPEQGAAPAAMETGRDALLLMNESETAAPIEDDEAPVELLELLPETPDAKAQDEAIAPVEPGEEAASDGLPDIFPDVFPDASPLAESDTTPDAGTSPAESQSVQQSPAVDETEEEITAEEFLATAGLEGQFWKGEPAAEPQEHLDEAPEETSRPLAEPLKTTDAEPEPVNSPSPAAELHEAAPVAVKAAVSSQPVTPAEFLEATLLAEPETATSAPAATEAAADIAAPLAESVLEFERLPQSELTPEASSAFYADAASITSMAERPGEATLSPVNAAPAQQSYDAPAPAGKGAWNNYSLHDEWVGEPMPIGTPVTPQPGVQAPVSPAFKSPVANPPAASAAPRETKGYTSPSLSHPGDWVGEPMPISRPAAENGESPAEATPTHQHKAPPEMPRTATGRLILKLLGSAGDRPQQTLPDPIEEPLPQPEQPQPPEPKPEAPAAPRPVSAVPLKSKHGGSSIMNFIAGAADALRGSGHPEHQPDSVSKPDSVAPVSAPQPARQKEASNADYNTRAEFSGFEAVDAAPPMPQREMDQTIPLLVARLDTAMEDAQHGYRNRRCSVVGEAAGRIAAESDAFGFRVLARMARCVERAAKANDMNALRDLLPELAVAVERNRIALTPRR